MSIKPLPGDVVAQIKSSVVVTSLNNVICGLIRNSLDAEATKINVTVHYSRGNCSIEDNGNGIPPSEFKEGGGLGRLHRMSALPLPNKQDIMQLISAREQQDTSKFPSHPEIHGKHGVFLASVASLSLLSITSHHRDFHSHNSMSIHNSQVLTRHTPSLPEQRLLTFSHGTRFIVRDLFGSMPVRVKHRALQAEKSTFSRDWDRLLLDIVALLIAWPDPASVSIRDASSRHTVTLQTDSEPRLWANDSCRILHQASLCDSPDASSWVAIGASSPTLSVSGYVCREPVATKRVQFISLGIEPLSNEFRCNVLYEEVNKVFADSSFGLAEDNSGLDDVEKKQDGFTGKELRARKGVDKWPMFFLKMTPTSSQTQGPLSVDEILDDRQPSLALITDLLKAMFYEFLRKNQCRPRRVNLSTRPKLRTQESIGKSPRPNDVSRKSTPSRIRGPDLDSGDEPARKALRLETSDSISDSRFAPWSRIKSGQQLRTFQESAPPRSETQSTSTTPTHRSRNSTPGYEFMERSRSATPADSSHTSLYDANGKLTRKPFEDMNPLQSMNSGSTWAPAQQRSGANPTQPSKNLQDETFEWINPVTKMVTTINARTGFTMAPKPLALRKRDLEIKLQRPDLDSGGLGPEFISAERETVPWVRDLIGKWKNPVFEPTEAPIPKLPNVSETLGLDPQPGGHHCHHGQAVFTVGTHHETSAMGLQGRISKDTLKKAQLIAQVDKKFIFAILPFDRLNDETDVVATTPAASSVLVLIDQHAADERCRVEGLMQEYFRPATHVNGSQLWTAVTQVLPKPVQFELSAPDREVLGRFQQYFAYWGIFYDVENPALTNSRIRNDKNQAVGTKAIASVYSLPPAVLERCRTEPRLLVELMRKEAWRLNDESPAVSKPKSMPVSQNQAECDVPVWVSLFHGCPQGIVELINSRSCRSMSAQHPMPWLLLR